MLDHIRERLGDLRVLRAMEQVERSDFVPAPSAGLAYEDIALPIGEGQTISQPYIVALMVDATGAESDRQGYWRSAPEAGTRRPSWPVWLGRS